MENQSEIEILKTTKSFFSDTYQFERKWDAISDCEKTSKLSRLYRWLKFMNSTFMHNSIPHYNVTINALLELWKSNDILYNQTDYEFNLSLNFYKVFFHQVRNKSIIIDQIEVAKKLLILSYLFSKYHGMLQYSIHNQLANLSHVVNDEDLTDIIIKSFVKYETPHYLISNIQHLNTNEIQFLMEAIQGNNLRESLILSFPISKKEFSRLMSLKLDSKEFRSEIILRGLILVKLSNGRAEDFNLVTAFLISSNTFITEPLKYLNDIAYWIKAYCLLSDFFIQDFNNHRISHCVDFLDFERYESENSFSLKGRTQQSLIRLIEEWHHTIFSKDFIEWRKEVWVKSAHPDIHFSFDGKEYFCQELNSGELLHQEGQELKHCVISYFPLCQSGFHTIWSLKKYDSSRQDFISLYTLEVSENEIFQIAGLNNRLPNVEDIDIVSIWAERMEFKIIF